MVMRTIHPQHPSFATILMERVAEQFLIRFDAVSQHAEELLIVSPVLGTLSGTRMTVERLRHVLCANRIRTYLVTRSPENDLTRGAPGHRPALETFGSIEGLEIRYNDQLHAKLYVCICDDRRSSFAVIGSANLTKTSIVKNIEVGIMIRYAYQGQSLIDELKYWVKNRLRLQARVAKPMVRIRK